VSHLCIRPVCGQSCDDCNKALSPAQVAAYAKRYAYLKAAPIDAVKAGGIFAGKTPENIVLNGVDLDAAIDAAIAESAAA
jgi:hypothetical protein